MTSDTDLVELTTAKTAIEAEWLVGALKGLGIHAVTFGDKLADEYAMSQKLMGLGGGVRVMVPRGELERAQEAQVEIERERPAPDELAAAMAEVECGAAKEDVESSDEVAPAGGGKTFAIVILALAVAALGWLSISQHKRLVAYEQGSPVSDTRWTGGRWETRWRHNGRLSAISLDRNRNGVSEESWFYDRDGKAYAVCYDKNENEIHELTIDLDSEGAELCRHVDENENCIPELFEYAARDGVLERGIDADEDGRAERREIVDADTGELLGAFEYRGREGYIRVK